MKSDGRIRNLGPQVSKVLPDTLNGSFFMRFHLTRALKPLGYLACSIVKKLCIFMPAIIRAQIILIQILDILQYHSLVSYAVQYKLLKASLSMDPVSYDQSFDH